MTSVKSVEKTARPSPAQHPPHTSPQPVQRRTRSLSPSRMAVLRYLEEQPTPVTLHHVAKALNLHENTVRGHLDALLNSGYVTRTQEHAERRGRPAWLWRPVMCDNSEYAQLAAALAATIHRTSPAPELAAKETGNEWGHNLVAHLGLAPADTPSTPAPATSQPDLTAVDDVSQVLSHLGFAPVRGATTAAGSLPHATDTRIELTRCPLIDAARRYPSIVCSVHLGLIEGAAEAMGHHASGSQLIPFATPDACALHLRLHGTSPDTGATERTSLTPPPAGNSRGETIREGNTP